MSRSGWRGSVRHCPVCGKQRTVKEFQTRGYGGKSTKRLAGALSKAMALRLVGSSRAWLRSKGVGRGSRARGRCKGG